MTTRSSPARKRVLLGLITSAHGIRGHVQIRTYTGRPEDIAAYGPLEDEPGQRQIAITPERVTPKGLIASIEGVGDRTGAEKLAGTRLYIGRDRLPKTQGDEFYQADLVGLTAVDETGAAVGTVAGLHNFGAGDIIEIAFGGAAATEMLPFTGAVVPRVDLEAGVVEIRRPDWVEVPGEDGS